MKTKLNKLLKARTTPLLLRNRPTHELNWGICFGKDKEGWKKLAKEINGCKKV